MLMALGSFLLGIGLLTIPHDAKFSERLLSQSAAGFAAAKQTFIGAILIVRRVDRRRLLAR